MAVRDGVAGCRAGLRAVRGDPLVGRGNPAGDRRSLALGLAADVGARVAALGVGMVRSLPVLRGGGRAFGLGPVAGGGVVPCHRSLSLWSPWDWLPSGPSAS